MGQPRPLFRSFQTQTFTEKIVDFSRIQTWIVGVEGQPADHLTTPRPKATYWNKNVLTFG